MEFFEAPAFARYVSGYLTDDGYRETTKPAGGCTRAWRRYPRNWRISEASLDRSKTRQTTKRRSARDLLLLPR